MTGIRIAVTGTPGVGKTSFCEFVKWTAISVQELAIKHDCVEEIEEDGVAPINIEKLREVVDWPQEEF